MAFPLALQIAHASEWGGLDRTFDAQISQVFAIGVQLESFADGRVAVAGDFHRIGDTSRNGFAIVSPDGTVTDFDIGLGFGFRGQVTVRADGAFWTWGYSPARWKPMVERREFTPEETPIPTQGGYPIFGVPNHAIHPDRSTTIEGATNHWVRFDTNGTVNGSIPHPPSFAQFIPFAGLADGAIAGTVLEFPAGWPYGGGKLDSSLRILETNGTVNPSFRVEGSVGSGKVFASSNCFYFELRAVSSGRLYRVENRALDTTFSSPFSSNSWFVGMAALLDGGAIVAGYLKDTNELPFPPIVRLDKTGSLVPAFTNRTGPVPAVLGMTKGPSNTWYAAVMDSPASLTIQKFDTEGQFHPSFRVPLQQCPRITSVLEMPDRRLLVGADNLGMIMRNPDGSTENATAPVEGQILELDLHPDGGYVQFGQFGNPQSSMRRIAANGDPVAEFQFPFVSYPSSDLTAGANQVSVTGDGKILVSSSIVYSSQTDLRVPGLNPILRLLGDGSVDPAFVRPTNTFSTNSTAHCHYLQKDGRILLSGNLESTERQSLGRLVRLDANGSLDPSFGPAPSDARPILVAGETSSGKLVLWSLGKASSGSLHPVRRILDSGAPDGSFHSGLSATSVVTAVTLQRDDRILVAGELYSTSGLRLGPLVRLEPDGAVDASFQLEAPFAGDIEQIVVLPDGDVLVAGMFEMDGQFSLVKLRSAEKPRLRPVSISDSSLLLELSGNTGKTYAVQSSSNLVDWLPAGTVTLDSVTRTTPVPLSGEGGGRFHRAVLVTEP